MTTDAIGWRDASEAPQLVPLLCYWGPDPNAEEELERPEFWSVAVRWNAKDITRWYDYCPMWPNGCGNPTGVPDFFMPLPKRPEVK